MWSESVHMGSGNLTAHAAGVWLGLGRPGRRIREAHVVLLELLVDVLEVLLPAAGVHDEVHLRPRHLWMQAATLRRVVQQAETHVRWPTYAAASLAAVPLGRNLRARGRDVEMQPHV